MTDLSVWPGNRAALLPEPVESVRRHWLARFILVWLGIFAATTCALFLEFWYVTLPPTIVSDAVVLTVGTLGSLPAAAAYIFANYGFARPYQTRPPVNEHERGRLRSDRILTVVHAFLLISWPTTYLIVRIAEGSRPEMSTPVMAWLTGLAIGYFTLEVLSARGWRWWTEKPSND
ncbi:hypothetical protein L5876_05500 [Hyphobacterium sp. SN044]|uniref:hypothetical protein n=1 Tax=Hyphobacterium sp. SN044 TaxID=2912575 RepID=UPI001F2B538F|nr:hypothetical protein [Hyphobacterium sp. SN044]MCF8879265.1 hypothetical protein [Hyphobacterium sp. SN044]